MEEKSFTSTFHLSSLFVSSQRRNKYHPYQAPAVFDENANEPFHDENEK